MGQAAQQVAPAPQSVPGDAQAQSAQSSAGTAVVRVEPAQESASVVANEHAPLRAAIQRLPVELDVMVPVRDFKVRNLLALDPGQVIESKWNHGEDVQLAAGDVSLAWAEFEVIDSQLAVRITRLP